jgi:hypothetical protein
MKILHIIGLAAVAMLVLPAAPACADDAPAATQKLHREIVQALKTRSGTSMLVDIAVNGGTAGNVLAFVARLDGAVVTGPDPVHNIRAKIPLSRLEALAAHEDVRSIAPAAPTITSGIKASPTR